MTRHWLRGWVRHAAPPMAAIAAAGMLAACGSSNSGTAQSGGAHGTVIGSFTSAPYTADFNPYSPGNQPSTTG